MQDLNAILTELDVRAAAIYGHTIGVILRFGLPLLIKWVKGKFKPLPIEWKYVVPGLYANAASVPAALLGLPALLETWNINPESKPVPMMVLAATVFVGYVGFDQLRELLRPAKPKAVPEGGL